MVLRRWLELSETIPRQPPQHQRSTADRPELVRCEPRCRELWTRVGAALGVNDAGDAVGRAGNSAAMWSTEGDRTTVPAPGGQGFVRGEGRDLNNAGHAVFVFFIPSAEFE